MKSDVSDKIRELNRLCVLRGYKVGLAESCTGGLLSSWITQEPGISGIYQGSVVSYARRAKEKILGVNGATIKALGEVSEPVAKAMARGARVALECQWAVSITGIAGPSGGTPEKPVGTVCFAVSGPGFEQALTHQFDRQLERQEIQRQAAVFALDLLLNALR